MKQFISLLVFFVSSAVHSSVSEQEVQSYIRDNGLTAAIAQLFVVGIPTDYKNSSNSSDFKEILTDINVGGVMLNGYNLPYSSLSRDERGVAFTKASNLVSLINATDPNRDKYPVLIYADFESYSFSSIKYPLMPPPTPLALASTGDTKYSYYAGKVSGYQLKQLGIDVILGPVLDPDSGKQGTPNNSIAMRAFSDTKKIIIPHALAFVKGTQDSGISAFVKHYPTYGSVYSNAHKDSPTFIGSTEQLKDDLLSFTALNDQIDGIMTSHLIVQQSNKTQPVTYNRKFIDEYVKPHFPDNSLLLITDDLSNMESSKTFIKNKYGKFDYTYSALNAFKSGHDLLLFSHLSGTRSNKHSDFNIQALKGSIAKIEEFVRSDERGMNQLVRSLSKVLELKAKHPARVAPYKFDFEATSIFENDDDFGNLESFYTTTFDKGLTKISDGDGKDLTNLPRGSSILFIGTKDSLESYKEYLDEGLEWQDHEVDFSYRTKRALDREKKSLIKAISNADNIYFSITSVDHVTLLDYIRIKSPKLLDKIIVFVHSTPHIITPDLLNSVLIYGNYSRNPLSYNSDIKLLLGDLEAKSIKHSPLNIANGSIHSTDNTIPPKDNEYISLKSKIFNTTYERSLYDDLMGEKSKLKEAQAELNEYRKAASTQNIESKNIQNRVELLMEAGYSARFALLLLSLFFLGSIFFIIHLTKRNNAECYPSSLKFLFSEIISSKLLAAITVKKILIFCVIMYFLFPNSAGVSTVKDSVLEALPAAKPVVGMMEKSYDGDFDLKNTAIKQVHNN